MKFSVWAYRRGSYGNATTVGCKKCDCNGHWDEARGRCHQTTGKCFCTDNTEGDTCDKCKPGEALASEGGQRPLSLSVADYDTAGGAGRFLLL